jgi:hypothetical protein
VTKVSPSSEGVLALVKSLENPPAALSLSGGVEGSYSQSLNGGGCAVESNVLIEERERPEPSEQTLAAMVEHLEVQVSTEMAPIPQLESSSEPSGGWGLVEAIPRQQPELDEAATQPYLDAQRVLAEQLLDAQEKIAREGAIGTIVDSFRHAPSTPLLGAPQKIQYPDPPVPTFFALPGRPAVIRPPETANHCAAPAPEPLLLPGPCLPSDLRRLQEPRGPVVIQPPRQFKLPTWVISLLVVILLVLVGVSILQNLTTNRETKAASVSPYAASQSPATPEAVPADAHPFGRYVEVTALRVVADPQKRSQLQYIVVNHSNLQLTGMTLHITVHSSDPGSKGALVQVSAVIQSLGPYESKEIRTDLDTQLRSTEIPEWDHLKADVQVTTR